MSMDNRSTSALFKRAEQLKRWDESEANKHSGTPKSPSMRRIKFSSGCIFLAACVAGDKDEVSRLLETGADIDTANVDGLTALHQACIDDNLDMVEFLVQNGADVNRKDNEGWTPLHATSSCGFLSIARYLIESGADLASINSDGELALDLACSDAMEDLIQRHIDEQGIDCEDARQAEEKIMLSDAKRWLRTDSTDCDKPHPKTGATALHVAAAKGYTKVLSLLLDGRGDFDKQDVDGWTALHAAAYWGQKEAVQILLNANVDIDIQNYSGQYAIDIAQKDIVPLLDEARKNFKRPKRRPASQIRITDTIENSIETPTKVIRVEVKPIDSKEKEELAIGSDSEEEQEEEALEEDENGIEDEGSGSDRDESIEQEEAEEEEEEEAEESEEDQEEPEAEEEATVEPEQEEAEEEEESEVEAESSPYSSSADSSSSTESSMTESDAEVPEKENQPTEPDVILRRTQSFESDEKFYQKYVELRARIQANSCPILPNTNPTANAKTATNNSSNSYLVQRSASLKDHRTLRKASSNLVLGSTGSTTGSATTNVQTATTSPPTSPTGTPVTTPSTGQIRRSFVPPTRDEESETQRKAHAKRVRETRRSTQGVTLDEIKSAEQLVKKKNSTNSDSDPSASSSTTTTTTTTPSSTASSTSILVNDRVPSVDASSEVSSKVPSSALPSSSTSTSSSVDQQVSASFTISAPPSSISTTATVKSHRGDGGGGGGGVDTGTVDDDIGKISVSYTITTPRLSSSITTTTSSSSSSGSEATTTIAKDKSKESVPSVTATFSVPSAIITSTTSSSTTNNNNPNSSNNNIYKKTDSDELTKTTTTTTTKSTIAEGDSSSISTTPASSASVAATIRTPSSFGTSKRSLFDIDNANSLTLAEKLRQEANKYAESDKENFVCSKVPSTATATATTKSESTSSNTTPAAAVEGAVSLRKDTSAPSSPLHQHHHHHQSSTMAERRPSWRLKVDAGSKFKLEDATAPTSTPATNAASSTVTALDSSNSRQQQQQQNELNSISMSSLAQRRQNGDSSNLFTSSRPTSAPELSSSAAAVAAAAAAAAVSSQNDASLHLRNRPLKASGEENKENDKENENRSNAQATQAVIQRRRRPKRRSTGVVHVDMEDIDPERQDSPVDGEEKESGTERGRSRVGSTASELADQQKDAGESKENGGDYIDYKALYEQAKADNNKLKSEMRKKDEEVASLQAALERFTVATTKNNSLSELEKRERRAMERKMSEMEEELKLLQKYKTENERLRAENRALTRVVSKLTTSAQNQLHSKQ
ncbi:protein phosphatase 1 regulatory subunit 12A isoform X8 [Ochlerotatus camptorhynchus]|uniref:protein phosphatase 1 regulatory subunit 12A isoform X8 n=1 Tax=Ochlerotatus camptorhynchus TaxID=644619 RepID=UPI0031E33B08